MTRAHGASRSTTSAVPSRESLSITTHSHASGAAAGSFAWIPASSERRQARMWSLDWYVTTTTDRSMSACGWVRDVGRGARRARTLLDSTTPGGAGSEAAHARRTGKKKTNDATLI